MTHSLFFALHRLTGVLPHLTQLYFFLKLTIISRRSDKGLLLVAVWRLLSLRWRNNQVKKSEFFCLSDTHHGRVFWVRAFSYLFLFFSLHNLLYRTVFRHDRGAWLVAVCCCRRRFGETSWVFFFCRSLNTVAFFPSPFLSPSHLLFLHRLIYRNEWRRDRGVWLVTVCCCRRRVGETRWVLWILRFLNTVAFLRREFSHPLISFSCTV